MYWFNLQQSLKEKLHAVLKGFLLGPCDQAYTDSFITRLNLSFSWLLGMPISALKKGGFPRVLFCFCCVPLVVAANTGVSNDKIDHSEGKNAVILVVGDSLSAAYNLAEEQGWVALLAERIKTRELPYRVVNASVGGATTAAGLQRLPSLLKENSPSIVIVQLGANDGLQGKPVPYITRNLESLIERSSVSAKSVVLVGVHLPPNFGKRYTLPFFAQYKDLANKYQLPLVPFLLDGVAAKPELMQEDRLHPNAKAQPKILENVWVVLETLLTDK